MSVAAAFTVALLPAVVSPAMAARATKVGDVQKAMEDVAKTPGVVGVIGGAYVDGRLAGRGTAGSRLLNGQGGRIPADARFRVGSQSKWMVATVILQLVKEGRLGLEDKLSDVLPEVATGGLVELADQITIKELIQHTSGVPGWFYKPGTTVPAFNVFDFTTHYRPMDIVKMTRGLPRTGAPGEKYFYSDTNYTLLGMIIERSTGHSLSDELDRRLFHPLGMTRTYHATKPPEGIDGPHGHGYYPDDGGALRDVDRFNASWGNGAGGVVSTTRDVSAFQRAFNQGKLLPPDLQKILTSGPKPGALRSTGSSCEDDLKVQGGDAPGYVAMTFFSTDGRKQLAVSVTRSVVDDQLDPIFSAIFKAGESVLCPAG
ncbi:beta-lactamase family protein [Actinomadura barringtoniae]|uniref:Beta-lactamase family protein n=1 Tax=Actinomadura barringtoniae TaxID=1427535 RepID=A0A939P5Y1_9ACTN|nr:serine hydrolase domain-containing protein [Actinomadura barringtoniae]MBO2445635.1 beta-lactamase family protein [Actinomadura barringtoniae]